MERAAKVVEPKRYVKSVRVPRKILAFQQVAAQGERRLIEWFVNKESVKVDSRDRNMNTALMLAAANGEEGGVGGLLELGADSNAVNQFKQTALMLAAANGHLGTVRILLGHRAKAYLKDEKGMTASDYARESGHWKVARIIGKDLDTLNKGANDAKAKGSEGEVRYYLSKGADPAALTGA